MSVFISLKGTVNKLKVQYKRRDIKYPSLTDKFCHCCASSTPLCDRRPTNMILSSLITLAAVAEALPSPQFGGNNGFTMLRFGCSQLTIDRIDPLVNPGQAPSPVRLGPCAVTMQSLTAVAPTPDCWRGCLQYNDGGDGYLKAGEMHNLRLLRGFVELLDG